MTCPKFFLILHVNWHPHGAADMWIHSSSAPLYVSTAIMVLLYKAAWFHRQVKGSMYHRKSRGDGPLACVMHFVVLCCWHVFGYAVFVLCNNAASENDDCRQNERGISGPTIQRCKNKIWTKIRTKSNNKIKWNKVIKEKILFGTFIGRGRGSFLGHQKGCIKKISIPAQ